MVIAAGFGWVSTGWVGCGLALAGLGIWAISVRTERARLRLAPSTL